MAHAGRLPTPTRQQNPAISPFCPHSCRQTATLQQGQFTFSQRDNPPRGNPLKCNPPMISTPVFLEKTCFQLKPSGIYFWFELWLVQHMAGSNYGWFKPWLVQTLAYSGLFGFIRPCSRLFALIWQLIRLIAGYLETYSSLFWTYSIL